VNSLKLNKIEPAKNCEPLKKSRELVGEEFNDDTVTYFMRNFESRSQFVFEIPKRILLRRVLGGDIEDYVIKDLCDLCKKWITAPKGESELLRFEAFIFLLDVEDFADMNIISPTEYKQINEKLTHLKIESPFNKFIELETTWKQLNTSEPSSIKSVHEVYSQVFISEDFNNFKFDSYFDRRILILKNRLYMLKLLTAQKEDLDNIAKDFTEICMSGSQNLISMHNLAVICLLQDKKAEAEVLIQNIIDTDGVLFDQTFAKLYLSIKPSNLEFLQKFQDKFETNTWYVYIRGLNNYNKNEYAMAYDYLQNALKKMRN
jgi:hypothetical protein